MIWAGFELLLIVVAAALAVESLLYLWAYRQPNFKALRVGKVAWQS